MQPRNACVRASPGGSALDTAQRACGRSHANCSAFSCNIRLQDRVDHAPYRCSGVRHEPVGVPAGLVGREQRDEDEKERGKGGKTGRSTYKIRALCFVGECIHRRGGWLSPQHYPSAARCREWRVACLFVPRHCQLLGSHSSFPDGVLCLSRSGPCARQPRRRKGRSSLGTWHGE